MICGRTKHSHASFAYFNEDTNNKSKHLILSIDSFGLH